MIKNILILTLLISACSPGRREDTPISEDSLVIAGTQIQEKEFTQVDLENYRIYDTTIVFHSRLINDSVGGNLLQKDERVSNADDGIQFKLENNETKLLRNDTISDGDDFASYRFIESLDEIGQWLIIGSYYESFDYILIDQNDGSETHLWGYPTLSPDKNYIVSAMVDLEAGFVSNGFQLWRMDGHKPIKVWEQEIADWGSDKLLWTKDNYIFAEQTYRDTSAGELKQRVIRLQFLQ